MLPESSIRRAGLMKFDNVQLVVVVAWLYGRANPVGVRLEVIEADLMASLPAEFRAEAGGLQGAAARHHLRFHSIPAEIPAKTRGDCAHHTKIQRPLRRVAFARTRQARIAP